ncbi:L-alanine-DL-glutamate epimerase-like enolase superfamily enzyme [Anaerospora hongkongensis]|uniref:L-alanine-DL-glutamate epimerase-like enolase superfamily enzyme n=1 Tax=Anaerospora hongkongensis TaxID=244830 RepID=A0A4R1Q1K8_9FIRM|nr:mandelate racemase/muconate lactonizing enzyme family protein [Anaerospora hongkongensis]TCL38834.1 L-alanine-DL-glutamate epimerase-like enolase superfamily enzyme [Anaerospora hongkongensis]
MVLSSINARLVTIPLGAGRGGSGATQVEVILVEIVSNDGIVGTGFSYALTGGGSAIKKIIEDMLAPLVIGQQEIRWEMIWYQIWDKTHRLGRGVALPALSALDIAIWDLRGKKQGKPLYELLGAHKEKIQIYGSGRATHGMSIEQLIEGAISYQEEGYKAIKLRAGALGINNDLARIKAVREHVPSLQMMIDCNERFNYTDALWFGKHLEQLDIYWMEEPLISDDVEGHRRLAEQLKLSIAVGEHLQGRFEFVQYLQKGAATVCQPDAPLVGGISEWRRIATIAEGFGVVVSPHFLPELHVHLAASTVNCVSIEHFPLINDILGETLTIEAGYAVPPQRPGHGIIWDWEKIKHFE